MSDAPPPDGFEPGPSGPTEPAPKKQTPTIVTGLLPNSNVESQGRLFYKTLVVLRSEGTVVKAGTTVDCTLKNGDKAAEHIRGTVQPYVTGINQTQVAGVTYVLLDKASTLPVDVSEFYGNAQLITDRLTNYLDFNAYRESMSEGDEAPTEDPAGSPPDDDDGGPGPIGGAKHWWCFICPGPDCH